MFLIDQIEKFYNRSVEISEKVNAHICLISKESNLIGDFYEAKI